jgi:hypothetical protein
MKTVALAHTRFMGKELHWEQNESFIFHHKFVVNVFTINKNSELRGEIDIGLNVKLSVIVVQLTFWHRSFTFNSNKSPT